MTQVLVLFSLATLGGVPASVELRDTAPAHATSSPAPSPQRDGTLCGAAAKRPGVLRVSVMDPTHSAVPGAKVTLIDPREGVILGAAISDSNGSAEFAGMGGKQAYVVAALLGFHTAGVEAFVSTRCEGQVELTLTVASPDCSVEIVGSAPVPQR